MRGLGLWLHVLEIHNTAVFGNEGDSQRQQRIAHPEAMHLGAVIDEQHTFVDSHRLAVHQTDGLLARGLRHFCLDDIHTSR